MGEDLNKQFSEQTKQKDKPYLQLADDELNISHDGKQHIHRVVFKTKNGESEIPIQSSIFFKIRSQIANWHDSYPLNFWKNSCYTLGLSKHGKLILYIKSSLDVFPKEFLRSLRQDFKFDEDEIRFLLERLNFVELEISHKINDPNGKLENAKIKYDLKPLIDKLIAFTDNSSGSLELELKGDPGASGNLEFLLRDKLHAILFFAELTKIVNKLTEIQEQLFKQTQYISRALTFILDDLLNKRFSEQTTKQLNKEDIE